MKPLEIETAPVLYENYQTVLLPPLAVLDAFEEISNISLFRPSLSEEMEAMSPCHFEVSSKFESALTLPLSPSSLCCSSLLFFK